MASGVVVPEVIRLRRELDDMLHRIRSARQIRPPIIRCPRCGRVGPRAEPDVSVRAMLIALRRFGVVSTADKKAFEKRWSAYRAPNGLDIYGDAVAAPPSARSCAHG